jgi:hypothetical protein
MGRGGRRTAAPRTIMAGLSPWAPACEGVADARHASDEGRTATRLHQRSRRSEDRPEPPSPLGPSRARVLLARTRVPYSQLLGGRDGSWPLRLARIVSHASLLWMGSLTGGVGGVRWGVRCSPRGRPWTWSVRFEPPPARAHSAAICVVAGGTAPITPPARAGQPPASSELEAVRRPSRPAAPSG